MEKRINSKEMKKKKPLKKHDKVKKGKDKLVGKAEGK